MIDYAGSFADKTRSDLQTLRGHVDGLATILLQRRERLAAIRTDRMLSAEAKERLIAQAEQQARGAWEALKVKADTAKAGIEKAIAVALKVERTPEEEVAYELRGSRLWARYKELLTSGTMDVLDLVQREAENLDSLEVLREELPDFLTARNKQPGEIQAVLDRIDALARPLLPDKQRTARDVQDEMSRGWPLLELSHGYALHELETGENWDVLPAWEGEQKVIRIA